MTTKNLLFVDDEDSIRLTLTPILKKHGFDVTAVATVADALAQMDLTKYDLLVSDLNIEKPGDGFAVIAAMKVRQPTCTNIILTAYPDFDTAQQAIRLSVADYFVKPVNIEELISAIAKPQESRSRGQLTSRERRRFEGGKRSQSSRWRSHRTPRSETWSTSRLPPPSFLFVHGLIRLSHEFSKRDGTPRIEVCDTEAERQHVTSFARA